LRIPWELVLAFAIGLGVMCVMGKLLLVPMRFLWRLAAGSVLGAVVLTVVNLFGGRLGIQVSVNPFTVMAVGFLGLPGALLLIVLGSVL